MVSAEPGTRERHAVIEGPAGVRSRLALDVLLRLFLNLGRAFAQGILHWGHWAALSGWLQSTLPAALYVQLASLRETIGTALAYQPTKPGMWCPSESFTNANRWV